MTRARDPIARLEAALLGDAWPTSDFDLNPGHPGPDLANLRPAAVLAGFLPDGRLVLTKRSARLKHHPGQIAFPGGKQDPTDIDLAATALREAYEEIGLDPAKVQIIGQLPQHDTVTSFAVRPFVGLIEGVFDPRPEAGEVDEVFTVPFDHIADPANYRIEHRQWRGLKRFYFTVPYGPYYIWGATARMLRGLAERL